MILLTNVIQSLWLKNKVKREEGYLPVAAPALPGQEELLRLPLARDNGWWPATSQPLLVFTLPCFGIRKSALNNNQLYYFSRWSWDFNRNAFKLKSIGLECSGQHGTVQVEYFCPFHLSVLAVIHLNWLLHHHHALERPICTFICTPHCNAQYVRGCRLSLHGRRECLVWRMTSIWGAEHGSLSTKLHFPATGLSLSRKWTICGRGGGWSLLSKKPFSAVLSQLRKLHPFPRSQSPIHQENSTKKTWNYPN